MKSVLVTGGTGFIGSRVVAQLCSAGYTVRCLVRPTSDLRRISGLPVEIIIGGLTDTSMLVAALENCDACIHLASPSSWAEIGRPDVADTIVEGTRRLVVASAVHGVRLVFVSSAAAINGSAKPQLFDETSPFELSNTNLIYAVAKHMAEQIVLDSARSGYDAVIVNPGETYGSEDDGWITAGVVRDVLHQWPALAVKGGTSVVHVDDVAHGIIKALENGRSGQRYILSGVNVSIKQLVRTILVLAGRRPFVLVIPTQIVRAVTLLCLRFSLPTPIEQGVLEYATRYWYMDSTKARTELHFTSRDLRQTLAPVVTWVTSLTDYASPPPTPHNKRSPN